MGSAWCANEERFGRNFRPSPKTQAMGSLSQHCGVEVKDQRDKDKMEDLKNKKDYDNDTAIDREVANTLLRMARVAPRKGAGGTNAVDRASELNESVVVDRRDDCVGTTGEARADGDRRESTDAEEQPLYDEKMMAFNGTNQQGASKEVTGASVKRRSPMGTRAEDDCTMTINSEQTKEDERAACPRWWEVLWEEYKVPKLVTYDKAFRFAKTPTYLAHLAYLEYDTQPYSDAWEVWSNSFKINKEILGRHDFKCPSKNVVEVWTHVFKRVFCLASRHKPKFPDEESWKQLVQHALRLVKTNPNIFGDECFNMTDRHVVFFFKPYKDNDTCEMEEHLQPLFQERHDLAQWLAVFDVLGKDFDMDGWPSRPDFITDLQTIGAREAAVKWSFSIEKLAVDGFTFSPKVAKRLPTSIYAYIQDKEGNVQDISVTTINAVMASIDATTNTPLVYDRLLFIASAVAAVAGTTVEEHFMPQTHNELLEFEWKVDNPENKSAYPKQVEPSKEIFAKVKLLHEVGMRHKKDTASKANVLKAGVFGYTRYKELWRLFREAICVYRHIYRDDNKSVVLSKARQRLGRCTTEKELRKKLHEDFTKCVAKAKQGGALDVTDEEPPVRKRKKQRRNDRERLDDAMTPKQKEELFGSDWAPPKPVKEKKKNKEQTTKYESPGKKWQEQAAKRVRLLGKLREILHGEGVVGVPMTFSNLLDAIFEGAGAIQSKKYTENERRFVYLVSLVLRQKLQW